MIVSGFIGRQLTPHIRKSDLPPHMGRPRADRPQQVPWPDLAQGQADRLRRMREKAGYSLRDLAVAAGVTTRTIQAIEAGGKGETSCAVIAALADALGVPRGWLAFGG